MVGLQKGLFIPSRGGLELRNLLFKILAPLEEVQVIEISASLSQ